MVKQGMRPVPQPLVSVFSEPNSLNLSNFGPTRGAYGKLTSARSTQPASSYPARAKTRRPWALVTWSLNMFTEPCLDARDGANKAREDGQAVESHDALHKNPGRG